MVHFKMSVFTPTPTPPTPPPPKNLENYLLYSFLLVLFQWPLQIQMFFIIPPFTIFSHLNEKLTTFLNEPFPRKYIEVDYFYFNLLVVGAILKVNPVIITMSELGREETAAGSGGRQSNNKSRRGSSYRPACLTRRKLADYWCRTWVSREAYQLPLYTFLDNLSLLSTRREVRYYMSNLIFPILCGDIGASLPA